MDRRAILAGIGATLAMPADALAAVPFGGPALREAVAGLERDVRGRMGVVILDTATGARFAWRGDTRFPMCSTFKAPLAGAVLARVDARRERLDRALAVGAGDIVANSAFSATRVGGTATIAELCAATLGQSDNTAANLLLDAIGGPAGLTGFLRTIGDAVTRLDRDEPSLNSATPGDPRDTTTPAAMLATIRRLTLGPVLTPASRARLVAWMVAATTGARRLRAGLPASWRVADRTGTGAHGSDNVVALLWPDASREPLIVASYITATRLDLAATNAIHARLARAIAATVQPVALPARQ